MPADAPLTVTVEQEDGVGVVRAIAGAADGRRPRVLVDLAGVEFSDSAGLHEFLRVRAPDEARLAL